MRLSMTFRIDLYDIDEGAGEQLVSSPGDYIRMREWADANLPDDDGLVSNLRVNFALAWFTLLRRGELASYGLPDELSAEAIDEMADRLSVFVEEYEVAGEDVTSPLPAGAPTS